MTGIYKITNLINNKVYIGQSVNIHERWRVERSRPFQPGSCEYNTPLCRAIRKYGIDSFKFEVIEECSMAQLNERERYYIQYYHSADEQNGYNLTLGGDGSSGHGKLSAVEVDEIRQLLQTTDIPQLQIADQYHVSKDTITAINVGRCRFDPTLTYPLRINLQRQGGLHHCAICGATISQGATLCPQCANLQQRKVERPDAETLYHDVQSLGFAATGRKYGVCGNTIKKWCKAYGLPTMAKDYRH